MNLLLEKGKELRRAVQFILKGYCVDQFDGLIFCFLHGWSWVRIQVMIICGMLQGPVMF